MLTAEELEFRREVIGGAPDLAALLERLLARARLLAKRRPAIPSLKGMLTADGGCCPADGAALLFDPWSPTSHRCSRCGTSVQGQRHDQRWAWLAHLWLGDRIAESAVAGLLAEDETVVDWAAGMLTAYAARYPTYPNADNVLGPARLFPSTYLESIWLTSYLAGAWMLRDGGILDEDGAAAVSRLAEEAAGLIGEFDEGLSNRQTWHNAALAATAVWFEDEDLAQRAIAGPRGLVGHLVDGFRADGMWYEGENYHLFALRGLLVGAGWARLAGVELFEEEASGQRLEAALRAPIRSALPDGTFPARKDARFGVSLAQPMYLELWERGLAALHAAGRDEALGELFGWLRHLYALPAPEAELFDSYLHEAGEERPASRTRSDLSWWALLTMPPELPEAPAVGAAASVLLPEQGLAILRDGDRYVSLECGEYGGGHGHPDRLHLTLHAGGIHWLADPGTGSYVSPFLFWYRSTLAHNAPRVDAVSQPPVDARAEVFDAAGKWAWVRGRSEQLVRTVVCGPSHLVDVVEFADDHEHLVELPWHPDGEVEVVTRGAWEPAELQDDFASGAERFVATEPGPLRWRATLEGRTLDGLFDSAGDLLRARGPDRPGRPGDHRFLLRRQRGRYVRLATVVGFGEPRITGARFSPGEILVESASGPISHRQSSEGWEVDAGGARVSLRGQRRQALAVNLPTVGQELLKYTPPEAVAHHLTQSPALDGTVSGFVVDDPLHLDHEDQYRRSEEAYPGPEAFAARAWLGWDETALFVAAQVVKQDPTFHGVGAPPLRLDNEADLIHSDGLQLYLELEGQPRVGLLVVPDSAGRSLQVHHVAGTAVEGVSVRGAWRPSETGYVITLAVTTPGWPPGANDPAPRFDLLVNEMRPGRARRSGQLVWTGGGGWVYLRGDRQDPARAGRLVLA